MQRPTFVLIIHMSADRCQLCPVIGAVRPNNILQCENRRQTSLITRPARVRFPGQEARIIRCKNMALYIRDVYLCVFRMRH